MKTPNIASLFLLIFTTAISWAGGGFVKSDYDLGKHKSSTEAATCETCAQEDQTLRAVKQVVTELEMGKAEGVKYRIVEYTKGPNGEETQKAPIYVLSPTSDNQNTFIGHTQKQALLASRDDINFEACSVGHDQGDLANRWCHGYMSYNFTEYLKEKGVSSTAASLAGAILFVPKEQHDLNMSAHDLVTTYSDSLGTERSRFEITVFGDAIFDNHVKKVSPFSGSTPFITWKRKLGAR